MPESLSRPHAAPLRMIALRLHLPELETEARQPGVVEAIRLTIQYHDAAHPDQVTTILKPRQQEGEREIARIHVAYRRANDKPLTLDLRMDAARYTAFSLGLRKLGFDRMDDMPDIPWYGADLWLLERGSGAFFHDMLLSPGQATGQYAKIVSLARLHLREAVRAINP